MLWPCPYELGANCHLLDLFLQVSRWENARRSLDWFGQAHRSEPSGSASLKPSVNACADWRAVEHTALKLRVMFLCLLNYKFE